jgi:alanyl-tRNA synthetase
MISGSLVDELKLRFDFNHSSALKPEQVAEIESICNSMVAAALQVYTQVVPLTLAKEICSLRAVFGET